MGVDHAGGHGQGGQVDHPAAGRGCGVGTHLKDGVVPDQDLPVRLQAILDAVIQPPAQDFLVFHQHCSLLWFWVVVRGHSFGASF